MIELTPHQRSLYDVLKKEARAGRVCPPMNVLAEMAGYQSPGTISACLAALTMRGLIVVHGKHHKKMVVITATGECTAQPDGLNERSEKVVANVVHGAAPCWRCGSRPDACMCGRPG